MRYLLRALILFMLIPFAPALSQGVVSADGRFIALFDDDGRTLVVQDASTGEELHRRALNARDGTPQAASAVIAVPDRQSVLIALTPAPELWEVALFEEAGPFHQGFVHSYLVGMEESLEFEVGLFARQRIFLSHPVTALALHPSDRLSVLAWRADTSAVRVQLAVRREIETFAPGEMPVAD
jgi:hypothetical protein